MSFLNKFINRSRKLRSRLNHCNFWCLGILVIFQNLIFLLLYIPWVFVLDFISCFQFGDANVYIYVNGEIPGVGTDMSRTGRSNIQRTGATRNFV